MIRYLTAFTTEIDFPEDAAADIVRQLNEQGSTDAYSVGILACHADYISGGVTDELSRVLGFPLVGGSAYNNGVGAGYGNEQLSLFVMTSDEDVFSVITTHTLDADALTAEFVAAYAPVKKKNGCDPALVLTVFPFQAGYYSGGILRGITQVLGGAPVFGAVTCSTRLGFAGTVGVSSVESGDGIAGFVIVKSGVTPHFLFLTTGDESMMSFRGVITESDGQQIRRVNGKTCVEYVCDAIGVSEAELRATMPAQPLHIDYGDGAAPQAFGLYAMSEEGYGSVCVDPAVGAHIAAAPVSQTTIMRSAKQLSKLLKEKYASAKAVIVVSCISRAIILGQNVGMEVELMQAPCLPLFLYYSGGEICPVTAPNGGVRNSVHNFSITACVLD
ncbi:MAG: hypothetical protein LBM78_01340 [Clostridiales bacterium]|jgi:hypothetical protein|nr:hypothetical protein [Clostridiales bacterium]